MEYMTLSEKKQYFCELLETKRAEKVSLQAELRAIGVAFWGERVKRRRFLKAKIMECAHIIDQAENALAAILSAKLVQKQAFVYTVCGRTPKWYHIKTDAPQGALYMITYVPQNDVYHAYDREHKLIEVMPDSFRKQYGRYRDFVATLDHVRIDYLNHIERRTKIYLTITDMDESDAAKFQ